MKIAVTIVLLASLSGCLGTTDSPEPIAAADGSDWAPILITLDALEPVFGANVSEGVATYQWTVTGTVDQASWVRVTLDNSEMNAVALESGAWSIPVEKTTKGGSGTITVEAVHRSANSTSMDDEGGLPSTQTVQYNLLAPASVKMDFGASSSSQTIESTVWVNTVDYDSAEMYQTEGASHAEYANIHDAMVAWETQTGHAIDYAFNQGFGSFSVERVNGEGNSLSQGEPPWWCYSVNGKAADQGISIQRFAAGDVIHWELGTCDGVGLAPG